MMIRTQVQLTQDQMRRLREIAKREGVSVAEVVRRCVERRLADDRPTLDELYDRALRSAGSLRDPEGARDLSTHHDKYLEEGW
jgi:hypothetical protein